MRKTIVILISIFLLVLDNSFFPFLAIKGVYPSALFVFAIAYSIVNGKEVGVFIGVVSGILQDIYFFNGFGVNCLINMLLCFLAGVIGESIWRNKKLVPVITIFFTSILKVISIAIILFVLGVKINLLNNSYTAIYNSVLMFLFYKLIYNICNKDFEWKKRNFR